MLSRIRQLFLNVTAVIIALAVLSSFLVASYEMETWPFSEHRPLRQRYRVERVTRRPLEPFLSAPGRVESARRTVVRCELENMSTSTPALSGAVVTGGSSTIISLIPEGTAVKQGDVLAKLDSSNYEELLRQQTITVEQAKASHLQALLDVEIAKIALKEYMEGTVKETDEEMKGSIALARANLTQAGERLEWTKRMNQKGYASVAQLETDKQNFMTLELTYQNQVAAYDLFRRFTMPKTRKTLEADITTAQTTLDSEQVKLNRQVERFKLLQRQVERCTIRAPHDGVVYYYVDPRPRFGSENSQIEEGMPVRQEQKLFYLPDLSEMEVQTILNESVVNRVKPGLRATVEFEALPRLKLEGQVTSVSQIPNQSNPRGEDVRFFGGIVKLDRSGEGLKPGMTAVVTFIMEGREDALAIPYEAIVSDQGRQECFVLAGDRLERREVEVGKATPDLVEITNGLAEGEEVVLDPPGRVSRPRSLTGFESVPWPGGAKPAADESRPAAPRAGAREGTPRRRGEGAPAGGGSWKGRKGASPIE